MVCLVPLAVFAQWAIMHRQTNHQHLTGNTITLLVEDEKGLSCSQSVNIVVNAEPIVEILSPADGADPQENATLCQLEPRVHPFSRTHAKYFVKRLCFI